jgi:hypothetical protein
MILSYISVTKRELTLRFRFSMFESLHDISHITRFYYCIELTLHQRWENYGLRNKSIWLAAMFLIRYFTHYTTLYKRSTF